jgi:virginiamycin B lyase
METKQNKMYVSRRKVIGGLFVTGVALSTGLVTTQSAFASTGLTLAQPAPLKFKASIKTSKVALKHKKFGKKASRATLKTYKLKTNSQATPFAAQDLKATFNSFPVKTTATPGLGTIVTGDTGSDFWFVESAANRIGKITTKGAITEYLLPLNGYEPQSIANGPGDTFWFSYTGNSTTSYIGRMIGASGSVTLYSLPDGVGAGPITRGPNDTLWFISHKNQVGSVTTDGALTIYTIDGIGHTTSIATGADGALWFTYGGSPDELRYGVARITTDGSVTFYPITNAFIADITTGRNNDLWFAVASDGAGGSEERFIGRITLDGTLTKYFVGSQLRGNADPTSIAHLGNGTFAFGTSQEGGRTSAHQYIGTVTPAGDVQVIDTPNADQVQAMVYAGWANEVWFTSLDSKNEGKGNVYKFRVTN